MDTSESHSRVSLPLLSSIPQKHYLFYTPALLCVPLPGVVRQQQLGFLVRGGAGSFRFLKGDNLQEKLFLSLMLDTIYLLMLSMFFFYLIKQTLSPPPITTKWLNGEQWRNARVPPCYPLPTHFSLFIWKYSAFPLHMRTRSLATFLTITD